MATCRYRFGRDKRNVTGFMSRNRASTDALSALSQWSSAQAGREHMLMVDEDEQVVVDLSWNDVDFSAGSDLDAACLRFGVSRTHVES